MITARIVHMSIGQVQLRINQDKQYYVFELTEQTLRSIYSDAHTIVMELSDGLHQSPNRDHGTTPREAKDQP